MIFFGILQSLKLFKNKGLLNLCVFSERENEFKFLERNKEELMTRQRKFALELCELNEKYDKLQKNLGELKEVEKTMESRVFRLWQLPSWLVINDLKTETE